MQDNYKFGFLGATITGGSECYNFVLSNQIIKLNPYKSNKQFIIMQIHNKIYFNFGTK